MASIRDWTESLWGKRSPYVHYRRLPDSPATLERAQRVKFRMPTAEDRRVLHLRDGYHCRFCGIPVIRKEIRERLRKLYPRLSLWGRTNAECHAALQATWAQYDHILPHSRGGDNDLRNIVITCAPCNFGRMSYTLEEVGLADARTREPVISAWDGLERLIS
jgi:5-methylcytosine-specific restriction endonuclease McrA